MNRTAILIAAALALASLPAATATWFANGEYEPNTDFDVNLMYGGSDKNPDPGVKQIYFNAFQNEYLTGVNPNSGTTGSRVLAPYLLHFQAYIGVWKDCNGDGYMGAPESAALSYRAELLLTTEICPPNVSPHNDGLWVHEFFHIGPWDDPENNTKAVNVLADNDTFVWGDLGVPGFVRGTSCPLAPPPHGTTSGSGAFIRYADCLASFRLTDAINSLDPNDELGLYFNGCTRDDGTPMSDEECQKNPQRSDSKLNQEFPESLFGNPRTKETGTLQRDPENPGEYAFTTWDCADPQYVNVHDEGATVAGQGTTSDGQRDEAQEVAAGVGVSQSQVRVNDSTAGELDTVLDPVGVTVFGDDGARYVNLTDDEGSYVSAPKPDPKAGQPTWSVTGSVNQTVGMLQDECEDDGGNTYRSVDRLAFFYADGDHEGTAQAPGKNQADMEFSFFDGAQAGAAARTILGESTPRTLGLDAGVWLLRPGWDADVIWVTDLQVVSTDTFQPSTRSYWTFYARLGETNLTANAWQTVTNGATRTYGADNCVSGIGIEDGVQNPDHIENGWMCDPDDWYLDPQGKDLSTDVSQRVGASYHLRDVDCHDGTLLRGVDARASLIGLPFPEAVFPPNPPCVDAPQ